MNWWMVDGGWWMACTVRVASACTEGRLTPTQSVAVGETSPQEEVWMVDGADPLRLEQILSA